MYAEVVELVDTQRSGRCELKARGSSTLPFGTKLKIPDILLRINYK